MTEALRNATLATQIVAYAYLALIVGALVLMVGASALGRLLGKGSRIANPIAALVGVGVIVGIPGALAAAPALLVTPLLIGMPLPVGGWLLIGAFALFGFWGSESSGGEMGGCTKMIGIGISAFGLCWAGSAILLADPPAGNAASVIRPLLVAAPLAIFLGKHSRGNRAKQTVGFTFLFAVLMAIAFLPVENGFAAAVLPASGWLRFPIMGGIVFGFWPLLALPLSLFGKRKIRWKDMSSATVGLGLIGAVFGLVWALTRLIF